MGIDAKVVYGEDLTGFMGKIADAAHVLMIVDDMYLDRADNCPKSGVAQESAFLQGIIDEKPGDWLTIMYKNNPNTRLPGWMKERNPKYLDFRYRPEYDLFPGSELIDDLWRWIAGLSADKANATSPAIIRKRMYRVERVADLLDPGKWAYPYLEGQAIQFEYGMAPGKAVELGQGIYLFKVKFSTRGGDSIYVYKDYAHAIGMVPDNINNESLNADILASYITSRRTVEPRVGQRVVVQNEHGCICLMTITDVREENTEGELIPERVTFNYKIFAEESDAASEDEGGE